jgi:triosephosphate isomerase
MKKLIAGNWKMNGSLAANEALLTGIKSGLANVASPCDVAVCAPGIYLPQVQVAVGRVRCGVGCARCLSA